MIVVINFAKYRRGIKLTPQSCEGLNFLGQQSLQLFGVRWNKYTLR